ncbi:MAG: TrmH family RNA methyltransferase, partial [Bacteroidota bacterium]
MKEDEQLKHDDHMRSDSKIALSLLIDNVIIPSNIGSIFRIADAFGIEHIYLTGSSCTPPNKKIRKTSRSTEKHVSFSYVENPTDVLQRLRTEGYRIIGLEIT